MPITLPIIGESRRYEVNPGKIIAVGLNYRDHINESLSLRVRGMDGESPEEPVLFNKTPNALTGPGSPIVIPQILADYSWAEEARTDFEGELVVIIGAGGKHIDESAALTHVLGYTCGNDVSQRNIQNSDRSGWFRGKSFDSFAPIGPAILPAPPHPVDLAILTRLNGEERQASRSSAMIFPIPRLIAYISRQFTLEAGDLIFTGTPSGVGSLKPGDRVEVDIEGIGALENPVIAENPGNGV